MRKDFSILFLGKQNDDFTNKALDFCKENFASVTSVLGRWGDPYPEELKTWRGDYIVSYLSRWIVRAEDLNNADIAALNFHPAPPEYPGIGCNNFALYDQVTEYGVTCHHMTPPVDTGPIVKVRRFPVLPSDNVASILARTYENQFALFCEIMGLVSEGKPLPVSDESWKRKPFTRREFNSLGRITPDMDKAEVERRIRATSFGDWKPIVELHGYVFELKTDSNH